MINADSILLSIIQAEETARISGHGNTTSNGNTKYNNQYKKFDIDLSVSHESYMIQPDTYFKQVNSALLLPTISEYYYRLNHQDWIPVSSNEKVEITDFDIETLEIKNTASSGTLTIIIEGVSHAS